VNKENRNTPFTEIRRNVMCVLFELKGKRTKTNVKKKEVMSGMRALFISL